MSLRPSDQRTDQRLIVNAYVVDPSELYYGVFSFPTRSAALCSATKYAMFSINYMAENMELNCLSIEFLTGFPLPTQLYM